MCTVLACAGLSLEPGFLGLILLCLLYVKLSGEPGLRDSNHHHVVLISRPIITQPPLSVCSRLPLLPRIDYFMLTN